MSPAVIANVFNFASKLLSIAVTQLGTYLNLMNINNYSIASSGVSFLSLGFLEDFREDPRSNLSINSSKSI